MSTVALEATPATRPPALPHPAQGTDGGDHGRPDRHLRLVSPPPTRASSWRRRAGALLLMLTLVALLIAAVGQFSATADLEDRVAGHVVIGPGETLWDVATATAPEGVDAREQLAAIEDLNGINASDVNAWTVVLLPAR